MKNLMKISVFLLMAMAFVACEKELEVSVPITADFDVTYKKEFEKNIYPSLIFGLSKAEVQLGENFDYFTITVNPSKETDIRIVVESSKLNDETIITQKSVKGKTSINPGINWKYDDLKTLSQTGTVDMTFVCYAEDTELARKSLKLTYKSINECILYLIEDEEVTNVTSLLAAYINENSPVIDAFMKDVLTTADTIISSFTGYQQGPDVVMDQVDAIFYTLRTKGIKYSDITSGSSTHTQYIFSQYIRFADEVLNNTQANCADGTVFFCSVLQKIGIKSLMIFVPGHVYLGFYLDDKQQNMRLLETTAVGERSFSFSAAVDYQVDNFNNHFSDYANDDYLDGYFVVDVSEARKIIQPIGR
jgi:hypothetical protein